MGSKQKRQLWSLMFFLFFIAAVFVPLVGAATPKTGSANTHFYVACDDKRIYTIDVNLGQVVSVSEPLPELGNPTGLDISRDGRTLYISSERGYYIGSTKTDFQTDYFPIVIVDVSTMQVKRKFHLEMGPPKGRWLDITAVYGLKVSPDGKTIFAGYAHPKYQGGDVAVDAETGAILRHLPGFYATRNQQNCTFSDDGRFATKVWSVRSKIYYETYSLETGEEVASMSVPELFASRQGLNPSWKRIAGPLSVIHSRRRDVPRENENPVQYILRTIDRMTGEVLLELDAGTPVFYSDSNQAILSRDISSVVRVDLRTGIFDAPIPVGEYPTNVVSVTGQ
jgi:hypothetical protein